MWITPLDTAGVYARMKPYDTAVVSSNHLPMPQKSNKFYHIKLIKEGRPEYCTEIRSPEDAVSFFQKRIGASPQEHFAALFLNIRNRLLGWREISKGTLNANLVHPRETYAPAVQLMAAAIIVAHNHPSGVTDPSKEDIEMTKRLQQAGKILGIVLLDHLIVSKNNFSSLKEQGML